MAGVRRAKARSMEWVFLMLLASSMLLVQLPVSHSAPDDDEQVTSEGQGDADLTDDDAQFFENFLNENMEDAIDPGFVYTTGIAEQIGAVRISGVNMMFRISIWVGATCNLGLGSEKLPNIPPGAVPGLAVQAAFNEHLFSAIVNILSQGFRYGYAVYRGVCIDYFPIAEELGEDPDNSKDRKDELLEIVDTIRRRDPSKAGLTSKGDYWFHASALPRHTHYSKFTNGSGSSSYGTIHRPTGLQIRGPKSLLNTSSANSTAVPRDSNFPMSSKQIFANWPADDKGNCMFYETGLLSNSFFAVTDGWWINRLDVVILSPNKRFFIVLQVDCNMVLYDTQRKGTYGPGGQKNWGPNGELPMWASDTGGKGTNCKAYLLSDGVFALFTQDGQLLWFTHQTRCESSLCWSDTTLSMQDDGNLVLYLLPITGASAIPIWSSKTMYCEGGCL
ncbi:hypothetical protein Mapa_002958 [Marchantia paleacea]|nr:hypothetical protein Mapa_002958 [Marchantia paleacea]